MNLKHQETVGVEIEFQLLDEKTLDLADRITPLMDRVGNDPCISPEVFQSCVEIRTMPAASTKEAEVQIREKLKKIQEHLPPLGLKLCSLGVHPFSKRISKTTEKERYLDMEKEFPYINHHLFNFSTHVHVSMDSLDQSIHIMNNMRLLLPVFIALSASCPFWNEEVTGFVSYRQFSLKTNIHGGVPPHFRDKDDFHDFVSASLNSGAINSLKDIHWDIKPRPEYGTLELRIMDASPTVKEAMALAAFARCVMISLKTKSLSELVPRIFNELPPPWAEQVNYFQAIHLGLDAGYIAHSDGETFRLKELASLLIEAVEEVAQEFDETDGLRDTMRMLEEGAAYERLTKIFEETHSFKAVVREATNDLSREMDLGGSYV